MKAACLRLSPITERLPHQAARRGRSLDKPPRILYNSHGKGSHNQVFPLSPQTKGDNEMSTTQAQPASGRNIVGIVIAVVTFLLLASAYVTVLRGYNHEGENRSFHIADKQTADEDYIKVKLKVNAVNPAK